MAWLSFACPMAEVLRLPRPVKLRGVEDGVSLPLNLWGGFWE